MSVVPMKTIYFDCFAGASGDMILGALVSAGADATALKEQLALLGVGGYEIDFVTVDRSGISATHARVKTEHEHKHRHLSHILKIINESQLKNTVKERAAQIFAGVVHRFVRAMGAGEGEFFVGGGARDHTRTHDLADLDRGEADSARGAEHDKRLSRLESAAVAQRIERRAVGDGQPGRALEVELVGKLHQLPRRHRDVVRSARVERVRQLFPR